MSQWARRMQGLGLWHACTRPEGLPPKLKFYHRARMYYANMPTRSLNVITASPATDLNRPLIVLVHGGALSHRMYRTTIPILSKHGYDVAATDLSGHGSSLDSGPFTVQSATRLLITAIGDVK